MTSVHDIKALANKAFFERDEAALLTVHRCLYQINLAHITPAWEIHADATQQHHEIKQCIESIWHQAESTREKSYSHKPLAAPLSTNALITMIQKHQSNQLHPVFSFLRDDANQAQLTEFFYQETPLEVLFADILSFMLPGTYGRIKIELSKNYWDEVGQGNEIKIHRNLRLKLMAALEINPNHYQQKIDSFIREELELINYYFALATNRTKHTELIGVMLATELTIPGRFEYLIHGLKRIGLQDDTLQYLTEHIGIDEKHADDWLQHVVLPILQINPNAIRAIMHGVLRRLTLAKNVLNKLHEKLKH